MLLAGVRIAVVPIALASDATAPSRYRILPGDARRYYTIASQDGRPYRDFGVEYPPVMVAAIDVIDGGSVRSTTVRLMWSQLVIDLAIAAVVAWSWGRRAGIAYLVIGLPFLVYPFIYLRLDLLSVLLAVLGIALVRRRHQYGGGAVLAIACFAKLWPLVLVPVLIVRRAWRALAAFVGVGVAGTAAWVAWGGIDGPKEVLTFRGAKGWEFESTVGALVRSVGGVTPHIERGTCARRRSHDCGERPARALAPCRRRNGMGPRVARQAAAVPPFSTGSLRWRRSRYSWCFHRCFHPSSCCGCCPSRRSPPRTANGS